MSSEQNLFEIAAAKLEAYNLAKAELEQAQLDIQEVVTRLAGLQANIANTLTADGTTTATPAEPVAAPVSAPEPQVSLGDTEPVETPENTPESVTETTEALNPALDGTDSAEEEKAPVKKRAPRKQATPAKPVAKEKAPVEEPVDLFGDDDDDFDSFNF